MAVKDISWLDFEVKNKNKEEAFEKLCTHLFCRINHVSINEIEQDYNQPGLEIFPVKIKNKYIGFQCKYCENSTKFYQQAYDSVSKALSYYPNVNKIILFTHLKLSGSFRKNSVKKKIENLCKSKGCEIVFFANVKFDEVLSQYPDIYEYYFSAERIDGLFIDSVSINDRNFLLSDKYYDLKLTFNEHINKFSSLENEFRKAGIYIIEGKAGTGKTEILKKIFIDYEEMYFDFIDNKIKDVNINFCVKPIFIKLREINTNDLLTRITSIKSEYRISTESCKFVYFFDGIDEISTEKFIECLSTIKKLKDNEEKTHAIFFSSRLDSTNYFILQNEIQAVKVSINLLEEIDKENYIMKYAPSQDIHKLFGIVKNNKQMFNDVFSLNVLCSNSSEVVEDTTIVELIEFNIRNMAKLYYRKINLLNLPEPKINCIKEIMIKISYEMSKSTSLKISIKYVQTIIMELYPSLDYQQMNKILETLIMMFFDIREDYINGDTYAMFKHKRYYEYFLFLFLKNNVYEDPFILRELDIFSQRELFVSFLLTQEMKEAHKNEDLFKVSYLGLILSRLSKDYCRQYFNKWINEDMFDDYNEITYYDKTYIDYLCLLNEDEVKGIIENNEMIFNSFINSHNNALFLFSYYLKNKTDLSYLFKEVNIKFEDFNEEYAYYKLYEYMLNKISFDDLVGYIFNLLDSLPLLSEKYYISCIKNDCNYNLTIIIKYLIEYEMDSIIKIISDSKMNSDRFDKLCFILIKDEISWVFPKAIDELDNMFIKAVESRIDEFSSDRKYYGIFAIDYLIHGQKKANDSIEKYISHFNVNHLMTWINNEPVLSILSHSLNKQVNFYHSEYKSVAAIKNILLSYKKSEEVKCIQKLLDILNEYIFNESNFFTYRVSIFISNIMSYLKFDTLNVKYFIDNVPTTKINKFAFIYNIFRINKSYFKQVFNQDYIILLYNESKTVLEEYDSLSQKQVMFSNMISVYDKDSFYINISKSLNYNIFRPHYNKENLISIREPMALYLMIQKGLLDAQEQEHYLKKNLLQFDVIKETLYRSSHPEMLKYLYDKIKPIFDYSFNDDTSAIIPIELKFDSSLQEFDEEFLNTDKYEDYNISSLDFWCDVINYLQKNNKMDWIYSFLKRNHYPFFDANCISRIGYLILAAIIKCYHKDTSFFEFIASNMSSEAYFQILFTVVFSSEYSLAKKMFKAIYNLTDVMVFYDRKQCNSFDYDIKINRKIMNIICNSRQNDWISTDFEEGLLYQKDPDIYIKRPDSFGEEDGWRDYREKWLEFYGHIAKIGTFYIYYKNHIIDSVNILSVDEGRAYIPLINFASGEYKESDYRFVLLICEKQLVDEYIYHARVKRELFIENSKLK